MPLQLQWTVSQGNRANFNVWLGLCVCVCVCVCVFAVLSPRIPGFANRAVQVGFMLSNVELGQVSV
jgi:hypothetical protein